MAKNKQQSKQNPSKTTDIKSASPPPITKRGKRVIAAGIGLVVIGFWVLTYTDPAGQNWASTLSPFLLIAGYALVGIGIVVPEAQPEPSLGSQVTSKKQS